MSYSVTVALIDEESSMNDAPNEVAKYKTESVVDFASWLNAAIEYFKGQVMFYDQANIGMLIDTGHTTTVIYLMKRVDGGVDVIEN